MLIISLLNLTKIIKEKHGVLSAVLWSCEDVPRDASRTTILHIFVSEEHVDVVVFESDFLSEALYLTKVFPFHHAVIVGYKRAGRWLKEFRHLLLPNILIIRVEVDLDVTSHHAMLLKQESLLEELAEGDKRWGSFEASIPESSALAIIAQSVVEVVLIFTDHVILARVFPG